MIDPNSLEKINSFGHKVTFSSKSGVIIEPHIQDMLVFELTSKRNIKLGNKLYKRYLKGYYKVYGRKP